MKVAIVGSRGFKVIPELEEYINNLPSDTVVVSGGAIGVDKLAETLASRRGLKTIIFPAEWDKYGKRAGYLRNEIIVKEADKVIAFWDGKSRGTAHTISLAKQHSKPLEIITICLSSNSTPNQNPSSQNQSE